MRGAHSYLRALLRMQHDTPEVQKARPHLEAFQDRQGWRTLRQILADFFGDIWHCRMASARWCRRTTSVHIASFFGEIGILRSTACAVPGALSLL